MLPPIYSLCVASAAVKALIGDPPRVYEFGEASSDAVAPYIVWQTISGSAENVLGDVPDGDYFRVQFDCYAETKSDVIDLAKALRDVIEQVADIASYNGEGIDAETQEASYSFDANFLLLRQ